jgi:drug/metabolite transporter (DMT)-like permease
MSNFETKFNSGKNKNYRWIQWFAAVIIFGVICANLPKPYNWIFALVVILPSFGYAIYNHRVKKK